MIPVWVMVEEHPEEAVLFAHLMERNSETESRILVRFHNPGFGRALELDAVGLVQHHKGCCWSTSWRRMRFQGWWTLIHLVHSHLPPASARPELRMKMVALAQMPDRVVDGREDTDFAPAVDGSDVVDWPREFVLGKLPRQQCERRWTTSQTWPPAAVLMTHAVVPKLGTQW